LEKAGVVKKIKRTSGAGLPLEAGLKDAFFKVLFLDVGLLHAVNGIYFISLPLHALEGFLRKNN
jgi:hypothetical protein